MNLNEISGQRQLAFIRQMTDVDAVDDIVEQLDHLRQRQRDGLGDDMPAHGTGRKVRGRGRHGVTSGREM